MAEPVKVMIAYISKDLELNKTAIREVNSKGLERLYLLYDGRTRKDGSPTDGWAAISRANVVQISERVGSIKEIKEIPITDPNSLRHNLEKIIRNERRQGNTVFIDGTSLRKSIIARVAYLCMTYGAQLLFVIPNSLYDPYSTFIEKAGEKVPLHEWASNQQGKVEYAALPKVAWPNIQGIQVQIVNKLSFRKFSLTTDLLQSLNKERRSKISEPTLRYNLRKLERNDIIRYTKTGKSITNIELTEHGRTLSYLLNE